VILNNAEIRGSVRLEGAQVSSTGDMALTAVNVTVGAVVNCCDGFTAHGGVSFSFANIGSRLCFDRAQLSNPNGTALSCQHLRTNELVLRTSGQLHRSKALSTSATPA